MTGQDDDMFTCMKQLKDDEQPFALVTVVRTEDATSVKAGTKVVVRGDGTMIGWVGSGCAAAAVRKAAAQALLDGQPRMIRVRPAARADEDAVIPGIEAHTNHCPSGGTVELFVEPVLPRPEIVILGASPTARALGDLARRIGYAVTVAALAEDHADFADVDRLVEGFDLSKIAWRRDAYVVVATQGKRDRDALKAALATPAAYVAMVASRRKAAVLKQTLIEAGVPAEALARLRAPAGIDIAAVGPAEIALSILAEIIRERHGEGRAARVAPEKHSREGRDARH